ncbi:MAG: hypothetical protein HOH21_09175 [Acidimicrobiaceae bacterium]|jgi:hypothetical protein|nr:hypothetical protein [Acidimicrobiaceae bacterium]MBT6092984.1 hypothetical protein [Acidimicrobiaceae bacterium]
MIRPLLLVLGIGVLVACGGDPTDGGSSAPAGTGTISEDVVTTVDPSSVVDARAIGSAPETTVVPDEVVVPETTAVPDEVVVPETTVVPDEVVVPETTAVPDEVVVLETTVVPDEVVVPETTVVPTTTGPPRVVEGPDSCIMDGFDRWGQLRRSAVRPSALGWDALDARPSGEAIGYWGFDEGAGSSVEGGQAFGIDGVSFDNGLLVARDDGFGSQDGGNPASGRVPLAPVTVGQGPSLDLDQPFTVASRTLFSEVRSATVFEDGGGVYGIVEMIRPLVGSRTSMTDTWMLAVESFGCHPIIVVNGPIYLSEEGQGSANGGEQRLLVSDRMVGAGSWHDYILTVDNRSGRVGLSIDGAEPEVWTVQPWQWQTPPGEVALSLNSSTGDSFDGSHDWILVAQGTLDAVGVADSQRALDDGPAFGGGTLAASVDGSGAFLSIQVGSTDWPAWQAVRIEEGWAQTAVLTAIRDEVPGDIDFVYVLHDNEVAPDTWQDWIGRFSRFSNSAEGLGLGELILDVSVPIDGLLGIVVSPTADFAHRLFLHETLHAWGQDVMPSMTPSHWDGVAIEAALGGYGYVQDLGGGRYLRDLTWMNEEQIPSLPPIELYLMGLVGPDDVPPLEWYSDVVVMEETVAGTVISARKNVTTIEEIIVTFGPRFPDHTTSQRDFRGVVAIITPDGLSAQESASLAAEIAAFEAYFASVTGDRATIRLTGLGG